MYECACVRRKTAAPVDGFSGIFAPTRAYRSYISNDFGTNTPHTDICTHKYTVVLL